ncbi:MAG TPA: hypothetical protein VHE80_09545 [Acidimicrobiales bacterium]|nr:hypothetical protein [Acidimicrobiales bacterium]
MSNIPQGSVCDRCGGGVGLNEEGRVVCEGCNNTTDLCDCPAAAGAQGEAAGGSA